MNAPVRLQTARLTLAPPTLADVEPAIALIDHPDTARYLGPQAGRADTFTRLQRGAGSWFLHGYGPFMCRLRASGAFVGNCGIFHTMRGLGEDFDDQPEAGWIIAADQVGKGLAREAMTAALDWFDATHGPARIVCMIEPGNAPSIGLAGKLGFAFMREAVLADGALVRLYERLPPAA